MGWQDYDDERGGDSFYQPPPKIDLNIPERPKIDLSLGRQPDPPGLTDFGKAEFHRIQHNQPPGLTDFGRQEMHRIQHNLPPGIMPYAMGLPGIGPGPGP